MELSTLALLVCSGFAAGLIGSMLGLGGGILVVPILVLVMKVPMHNAVATSLLCVIATSSAAASRNLVSGVANFRLGMLLEIFTVVGALLGGLLAGFLPETVLITIFGTLMLIMAFSMFRSGSSGIRADAPDLAQESANSFSKGLQSSFFDVAEQRQIHYRVKRLPVAMGVSSAAGVISGLLGVGGGIIKVPVLNIFCGVPMKAAAATSNFMIGVTAVASAWLYYGRGEILPLISAASVIGVFAGSRSGSHLAGIVHARSLRRIFAVVMIIVAAQMFARATGVLPY